MTVICVTWDATTLAVLRTCVQCHSPLPYLVADTFPCISSAIRRRRCLRALLRSLLHTLASSPSQGGRLCTRGAYELPTLRVSGCLLEL